MKTNWDASFDHVLKSEGGYRLTNIPGDAGGQTYAGIARVPNPDWEGWALIDRGEAVPNDMVARFYKAKFWDKLRCDDLPAGVDYAVYDFGVNAGPGQAAKFLQRAVGAAADGAIGPGTLALVQKADGDDLLAKFTQLKKEFYESIVARKPDQVKFLKGWMNRVAHVQTTAETMTA